MLAEALLDHGYSAYRARLKVLLDIPESAGSFEIHLRISCGFAARLMKLADEDACFHHCASLVADGKKEHAKCMHLCVDCADCCKMRIASARQSDLSAHAALCCAKCCDDCAAACEAMPDDKHMAARQVLPQLCQGMPRNLEDGEVASSPCEGLLVACCWSIDQHVKPGRKWCFPVENPGENGSTHGSSMKSEDGASAPSHRLCRGAPKCEVTWRTGKRFASRS